MKRLSFEFAYFLLVIYLWYNLTRKRGEVTMEINTRCKYIVEPPKTDLDFSKFLGGLEAVEESDFEYFLYGILNRSC